MTTEQLNVNSIKLTPKYRIGKVERKILLLIAGGYKDKELNLGGINFGAASWYPNEGCNSRFLVERLWVDGIDYTEMKTKNKVIVSRALHSLYRKGLVKMGRYPSNGIKVWRKSDDCGSGYYGGMQTPERFVSLVFYEYNKNYDAKRITLKSSDSYSELPSNTKKWWMLMDAGKALVESWKVPDKSSKGSPNIGGNYTR
jgi:hypothetical protein